MPSRHVGKVMTMDDNTHRRKKAAKNRQAGDNAGAFDDLFEWPRNDPTSSFESNHTAAHADHVVPLDEGAAARPCQPNPIAKLIPSEPQIGPFPEFSSMDEQLEFASLTTEEKVASEADVLGLTAYFANARIDNEIKVAVAQLNAELSQISLVENAAYLEAMRKCPDLISWEHKKAFLCREGYDVKLAAKRLVKYWQCRRELFGLEKFCLPLKLSGALRDDLTALQKCHISLLPVKDTRGRAIVYYDPYRWETISISRESMLRAMWYVLHEATKDPSIRDRGLVLFFRSSNDAKSLEELMKNIDTGKYLIKSEKELFPFKFDAIHFCQARNPFVIPFIKYYLGKRLRSRFKVYMGSDEEVRSALEQYGLPRDRLPAEMGGDVVFCQNKWLVDQLALECRSGNAPAGAPTAESQGAAKSLFSADGCNEAWEPIRIAPIASASTACSANSTVAVHPSINTDPRVSEWELSSADVRKTLRQRQMCDPIKWEKDYALRTSPPNGPNANVEPSKEKTQNKVHNKAGRRGDARMNNAVKAKLENPELSAMDALLIGGFVFPEHLSRFVTDKELLDTDGVTSYQRKNQLGRRLRSLNEKKASRSDQGEFDDPTRSKSCPPCLVLNRDSKTCMNRAVKARLENPKLSAMDALLAGGFVFPNIDDPLMTDKTLLDIEGVTSYQRKNQLGRRLRALKGKKCGTADQGFPHGPGTIGDFDDSVSNTKCARSSASIKEPRSEDSDATGVYSPNHAQQNSSRSTALSSIFAPGERTERPDKVDNGVRGMTQDGNCRYSIEPISMTQDGNCRYSIEPISLDGEVPFDMSSEKVLRLFGNAGIGLEENTLAVPSDSSLSGNNSHRYTKGQNIFGASLGNVLQALENSDDIAPSSLAFDLNGEGASQDRPDDSTL